MSNLKYKKTKFKFHWTHFVAVLILGGYFILSKINTIHALTKNNIVESFLQLYLFGIIFACLFLYIFSHDRFFPFAREIEKKEKKKEKKYLKKFLHHGKIFGTFVIGAIGGPVFSSLTARLLLNNFGYKYLLVILANIPSTVLTVLAARGLINFIHF
jgi:hypothetical protein